MISTAALSLIVFGIFVLLFIWDKLPMATSALLGCGVMVLLGIADFKTAFGQIASTTVVMLVGVMILGAAFVETGLANVVGNFVMKLTKSNERVLITVISVIGFALSTFLTNVTVLATFIPIIFAISASQKKIRPMNVIIPLTLGVNSGGITTLVGSSQQMTAQGLLEEYGYTGFKVFSFAPMGAILFAACLTYSLTIGYGLGKKIWGGREESEVMAEYHQAPATVELKKSKVVAMCVIFFIMIFLYIFQGIPFTKIEIKPVITAVLCSLACIITGCISQKKAVAVVNWNVVGRLAGCLGLAKVLESAGGLDIVSSWFLKLTGNHFSPLAFFLVLVLLSYVTSLFVSNSTAITITLLLMMSIAPQLGLNVTAFAAAIIFASSVGCACPLSASSWGVAMSAGYKFKDFFKYGLLIDLICITLILILVPLIYGGITV